MYGSFLRSRSHSQSLWSDRGVKLRRKLRFEIGNCFCDFTTYFVYLLDNQLFAMQQLLLNISDSSQVSKLMSLLSTLNYVKVAPYCEENLIVSEKEQNLIRSRVNNAKPEDFNSWDNFIDEFEK